MALLSLSTSEDNQLLIKKTAIMCGRTGLVSVCRKSNQKKLLQVDKIFASSEFFFSLARLMHDTTF